MLTGNQLRWLFLEFFEGKEHLVLPSFSLNPESYGSYTTALTSAGMQPLIPYFTGERTPPKRRLATCQKCCRADDVEEVGHTWRHLTFFEMLGNFSFGDYFKREAIEWAWEFFTEVLRIPKERLWVTVYQDDDEAAEIWAKRVGVPKERILRFGKKDNWWGPVGDSGPCGPCTEIFYDRGEGKGCGQPDCQPNCKHEKTLGCDRWGELWNLVFQQFDQQKDGTLAPLPKPGIDTGMGLERLAAAMQGEGLTVFDCDLFKPIVEHVQKLALGSLSSLSSLGSFNERNEPNALNAAFRIIADHVRAAVFLVGDGISPSNEGRGYVLRRFIRRAFLKGRELGLNDPFLHKLTPTVVQVMCEPYPELAEKQETIEQYIRREEERFCETLERGMTLFEEIVERRKTKGERVISGEEAFTLYDTYGFPLEVAQEMAKERGLTIDLDGFHAEMEKQRERARIASGFKVENTEAFEGIPPSKFLGYHTTEAEGTVVAVRKIGNELWVALDQTPFYAEAGGQVGDVGWLIGENLKAHVLDTQWQGEVIAHKVAIEQGMLTEGVNVKAQVDAPRRAAIRRAHTATHLLHAALRRILGTHVFQAGSLVEADRLRFDFSHPQPVSEEALAEIERQINEQVLASMSVVWEYMPLEKARQMGAMALFGEKYGETVRVVQIPGVSIELCGGTHLDNTAQVGMFKIISETGVGANLRRIDALTGLQALRWVNERLEALQKASAAIGTLAERLPESVEHLLETNRDYERKLRELEARAGGQQLQELLASAKDVAGIKVVTGMVTGLSSEVLRQLADEAVAKLVSGVVALGSVEDGKVVLVTKMSKDVVQRGGHAGNLVREIAKITGGGGGGRPDFAQAGGKDPSKLKQALAKVPEVLQAQLSQR